MVKRAVFATIASLAFVLFQSSAAAAQTASSGLTVPPVPPLLEVPAGHSLFFAAHAVGTQNYVCLPAAAPAVAAWKFVAPQATLYYTYKGEIVQQLTTHFLSANPEEVGVARPTWQHSLDSSRVWAKLSQPSSDPNYVEPGAIPWLLLEKAGTELGPLGGSFLAQTTYIQRLNTSGGVAPATGCSAAGHIGSVVLVPYSADYFFYRAKK